MVVAHIRKVHLLVFLDVLSDLVNVIRHFLGSRTSIGYVELDTKVVLWTTGIVRRSQEDTSVCFEGSKRFGISLFTFLYWRKGCDVPDECRNSRSGEDGVLSNGHSFDPIGGSDPQDHLSDLGGLPNITELSREGGKRKVAHEEPSVTSDDERLSFRTTGHGAQDSLDEVLGIVFLLEDLDLLPQTRSSGLLA